MRRACARTSSACASASPRRRPWRRLPPTATRPDAVRFVGAAEIDRVLDYPALVEALREAFRAGVVVPVRHHHAIARPGASATLLLMPAWHDRRRAASSASRSSRSFPTMPGAASRASWAPICFLPATAASRSPCLDGLALTLWRTAAASALAASYLARPDAGGMVMIGAGALAPASDRRPCRGPADRRGDDLEPHAGGRRAPRRRARPSGPAR